MTEKTFDEYLSELNEMYKRKKEVPVISEAPINYTSGMGSVIVVVNGGNNAIPLKNAMVKIMDKNGSVLFQTLTDESGKTDIIKLPAPALSESLTPSQNNTKVYALYDISAEKENYVMSTNENVPVFDSTVSIQEFNLVWLPASNGKNEATTENEGDPYNL